MLSETVDACSPLVAGCAEDFLFEIGDAGLQLGVLHAAQLGLDGVRLCVDRDDLIVGRRLLLGRHVLDDEADTLGEVLDLLALAS